ncbi:uncharacterized protein GGS25DRAFT_520360 [Hypoxylon fragiforme]|uniref:uncharacterized protein n=1 Tax=Hypoxylon fragiforme TaxID=63214 RepID=UPI0020C627C0|nr:uncharacterized protein GGS25DRAFT_520360 [Hypoxylon fragiforme]KAI2609558.1 hypothetical protein GGS25DRAFT_520360 [Hypoxylon fragiforme]
MDKLKKAKNALTGQASANQNAQPGKSNSTKDTLIDSGVDQEAQKKGIPSGADPMINNVVNDAVNKF